VTNSSRESIREAILSLGPTAEADVSALAIQLSSRFQQSGMTLQMIEEEIRRLLSANIAGARADGPDWWQDSKLRQD
jgi:hypothetical protein